MITLSQATKNYKEFLKNCNNDDFDDLVTRSILQLKMREAQCIEENKSPSFQISKWSIQKAIMDRKNISMNQAAIEYVESCEHYFE